MPSLTRMISPNLQRLKIIAEGLGELCNDVVFVGGTVAELYADNPAATEIRPTTDVDCVVELASYGNLQNFENQLRKKKFTNDIESGIICRWKYNGETVDIMPDDEEILGFTNKWYKKGWQHRCMVSVEDISIFILSPLYYIASKIEAVKSRGGADLRFSHDFEDIVYVLNNRNDICSIFDHEKNSVLKAYLSEWKEELFSRRNLHEEIECMLPYGDYDRVDYIIKILNHFSI